MNDKDFRQNVELSKQAHDLVTTSLFQTMLATLDEIGPHRVTLPDGQATTPHDMIRHLGQIEGWNIFKRLLLSLGQPLPKIPQPEVRYGAPKPSE